MKPTLTNEALLCRAMIAVPVTVSNEFMFMPAGRQTITPFGGGIGVPIEVMVDESSAMELERQRVALSAKGARPYFDFEHEDDGASFWPTQFFWRDGDAPGIYARGEWTADGKAGVEGRRWRGFSPVFHVDNKRARPARIICNDGAVPNMGGLVNNPAFKTISPLWAKNASGAESASNNNENTTTMNEQEMAALRAKNQELLTEVAKLKADKAAIQAKNESDEFVSARIAAKEAEIKANAAELELSELKAKSAGQEAEIKQNREATAKAAVQAAVDRGAIAAKDSDTIAAWEKDISENPGRAALLAKMQGNPAVTGERITRPANTTTPGVQVTGIAAKDAVSAYGAIVARNKAIPLSAATAKEKAQLADEAAGIYAADLAKVDLAGAILAADSTDADLGVLTGSLALQRSLPALTRSNPMLTSVTTDFSEEPGVFNRIENSRIVLRPAIQEYDSDLDSGGRPKGWVTASPAVTVDVPVKLDKYFAVPIVFGITTIAGTGRRLFDEQAPQAINAMGNYLTDQVTGLLTAGNFNAFRGLTLAGGATTSGSTEVTVTSTAAAFVGARISGTGIPAGAVIREVVDATTLVISKKATATGDTLTLTISGEGDVPNVYTTYAKAQGSFAVTDLDTIAAAFDSNNVPMEGRFALLKPSYYRKLGSDAQINSLMQGTGDASYLTERRLPKISNFELMNAPYMPGSDNRVGFAGHKASAVLKTRLPMDLTQALPGTSIPGSVVTVSDPSTSISLALVAYHNLQAGYAEWRPELMAGVAVGDRRTGLVMTSE